MNSSMDLYGDKQIYAFNILKFFASIGIALLHFNWHIIPQGYLLVEMFFMLSGFFLFLNIENYQKLDVKKILWKKLKKFYLLYILALFGQMIVSGHLFSLADFLATVFFLDSLGISKRYAYGAWWFFGVWIFCYTFYIKMFSVYNQKKALFIIFSIVFVCISSAYTYSPGHCLNRVDQILIGPFQFGLIRGLSGIGLGILLSYLIKNMDKVNSTIIIVLEVLSLCLLLKYLCKDATSAYDFLNYVNVSSIILCVYLASDKYMYFVNLVGKKCKNFFSLSLPIYIFHPIVCYTLKKFNYEIQEYPVWLYLIWVVLLAFIMQYIQKFCFYLYHKVYGDKIW